MRQAFLATMTAALGLAAVPASATTYAFSYRATTGSLAGLLSGELQTDGNTILLDAIPGHISFDGVAGPALPVLTTASSFYGTDRAPRVTLDGSLLDFFGCTDASCIDGVLFDPDVVDFTPLVSTGEAFGAIREPAEAARWSIAAVPEPATWLLLIAGAAAAGGALRRARAVSAVARGGRRASARS